jgi:HEAT repeat protein
MRLAYELGRDPQNVPLFDAMERGSSFERRLSLQSVYGSRDAGRALRLVNDPSQLVRYSAVKMLTIFGDSQMLEPLFRNGSEKTQRSIVRMLVREDRLGVIDDLCSSLMEHGGDWQALAPYATTTFLKEHFETAFARAGTLEWTRLARRHPRFALGKLLERARVMEQRDNALLYASNSALTVLSGRESELALQLVHELGHHIPMGELNLKGLLPHQPEALARLLLSRDDECHLDFSGLVPRLKFETLRQLLLTRSENLWRTDRWLALISLDQRQVLWDEFGRGWRTADGIVPLETLRKLPRAVRTAEAKRHIRLPSLAASPLTWLPYAALLEHEELLPLVTPLLRDPDPAHREAAHTALAQNVRFARQRVGELLELVNSRSNEQDPVRVAMLTGLADLPPSIWRSEHLATLEAIQRQALDARDLSGSSVTALEGLIIRILPHFPSWAASQFAIVVRERGNNLSYWSLESRLNDEQMRVVGPSLWPVFNSWIARDFTPFLGAMRSLGRRLKVWDEGAELLMQFIKDGPPRQAEEAAKILAEFRRDIFVELVPQLLSLDPSWGTKAVIYNFLHLRRQDLWTPALLGRELPRGRFWQAKTRFVLPLHSGFHRWNPEQQEMWALTLREILMDDERDLPTSFVTINQLVKLPDIEPTTLMELASLQQSRPMTREAALRVLGQLDSGQGVSLLIEALNDERARIAVYALRASILTMPQERALEILRDVPLEKVTVAKEVVRMLGDLKTEAAFELVLDIAARDLHRDVKIALLRALWEHLEDDRAWPILESAANSQEAAVARMAARTTSPRLSTTARRRLINLRARLLGHSDPAVRLEVLGAIGGDSSDPEKLLREPLFKALESVLPSEYTLASAAIWTAYGNDADELVTQAVTQLLPRRYALRRVVNNFLMRAQWSRSISEGAGRAIMRGLEPDPLLLSLRLQVAFTVLPLEEFATQVEAALDGPEWHAGAVIDMMTSDSPIQLRRDGLQALQQRWETSTSPTLRRLSLALLEVLAGDAQGWTDERVAASERFKADNAPLVASVAQWVFPNEMNVEELDAEWIFLPTF